MKKHILILSAFLFTIVCQAQLVKHERLLSFEDNNSLLYISTSASDISISEKHYKDGLRSLLWKYNAGGTINIKKDIGYEPVDPTGADTYLSTFIVWIYNEKPADTTIRFEFLRDGKVCTSFPFAINFCGWRAAWVCYDRDMEGKPEEKMNEIRIVAPPIQTANCI